MNEENGKNEYVTEKYLDKRLEERLGEQTQIILNAVDSIVSKRLTEAKEELKIDINNVQTLIDGYVKAQEDFKQEFVIMKEEVSQIKKLLKEKFNLEIKAF
jgi:hypothetical protein